MATDVAVALPLLSVSAETVFTVTQLRAFVTTALSDSALQARLDSAMAAIDKILGPITVHDRLRGGSGDLVMLSCPAETISTVVEDARCSALSLSADDYELSDSGSLLYRLRSGTHPRWRWHGRVDVTYVRRDDPAERIRVAVALVQLDLTYAPGLTGQKIGTWEETYQAGAQSKTYAEQRADILASLTGDPVAIR